MHRLSYPDIHSGPICYTSAHTMLQELEQSILGLAHTLPLEQFVFVASFIEEVIAPVPSAAVLLITGTLAAMQERTILELAPLIVIAAAGKTIGAIIVYHFSHHLTRIVFGRFGSWFKVTDEEIRALGSRITGSVRDYLIFTAFRALPILPSSVVSVGCGVLKIPRRLFLVSTLLGTIVRDSIFIYAGYQGTEFLAALINRSVTIESLVQMGLVALVGMIFVYIYWRRRRNNRGIAAITD